MGQNIGKRVAVIGEPAPRNTPSEATRSVMSVTSHARTASRAHGGGVGGPAGPLPRLMTAVAAARGWAGRRVIRRADAAVLAILLRQRHAAARVNCQHGEGAGGRGRGDGDQTECGEREGGSLEGERRGGGTVDG